MLNFNSFFFLLVVPLSENVLNFWKALSVSKEK